MIITIIIINIIIIIVIVMMHFDFLAVIKRQCAGELLRAAADLQSALDEALHWRQNAALAVACACALILLALFGPWHAKQAKRGRSPTRRPAKSRKRAPRRPEVKPFCKATCQHLWRGQVCTDGPEDIRTPVKTLWTDEVFMKTIGP